MKIAGSPALIAAQVYASATNGASRDVAAAQAARRQAAKFEVKDEVSVRADNVEDQTPKSRDAAKNPPRDSAAENGAGRREAPMEKPVLKRPGSLVNLTA